MSERLTGGHEESDAELDRALTEGLRTAELDAAMLARMHAAVAQEWRASVAGRPALASRRRRFASLAAAAGLAALTAFWFAAPLRSPLVLGTLTRVQSAPIDARFALLRHAALHAGDVLRAGERLTAPGAALVSLAAGGTLRIAAGTVIKVTGAAEIRLERGMIYVEKPPLPTTSGRLRVLTQAGAIEHLGTEFEVLSQAQNVRIRVREGQIRLLRAATEVLADAGTEITATPDAPVAQRRIATYGQDWHWAAALAPDYEIEGRPLLGFLQWVSRELGRHLEFADARVRAIAARTVLHGSVHGREPLDALQNVLATTTLAYEMRGDTIWVQTGP